MTNVRSEATGGERPLVRLLAPAFQPVNGSSVSNTTISAIAYQPRNGISGASQPSDSAKPTRAWRGTRLRTAVTTSKPTTRTANGTAAGSISR